MSRRVELTRAAQRDLRGLDRPIAARVLEGLEQLGLDGIGGVKPLQGVTPTQWRLRVGDWRVRFRYEGNDETCAIHVI